MKSISIIVLSIFVIAVTDASLKPRIYRGNDAYIIDYPYQVSIRYNGSHHCGASIISERHVLTAAHCIKFDGEILPMNHIKIHTGTSYSDESAGQVHSVDKFKIHPGFKTDGAIVNDIAVVTLKDAIKFDEYQQPIGLPSKEVEIGTTANVTGWGLVTMTDLAKQLQKLEARVISMEKCRSMHKMPVGDPQICTLSGTGSGTCIGDSGGPLAVNNEVIGVVSWSDGATCADGYPDVCMKVYDYLGFIKSAMNDKN